MSVVQADAYGHGAEKVSAALEGCGTDWLAVSNLEEALSLRENGAKRPILIFGYTPPEYAGLMSRNNISQTVFSQNYARALSVEASLSGCRVKIHIKIDTGMSRIGFFHKRENGCDASAVDQVLETVRLPGLFPEGIFTHFAAADEGEAGEAFTRRQYRQFCDFCQVMENAGVHFALRHCCNSGAVIDYPEFALDMVRPGIILYGLMPSAQIRNHIALKPAMELKSIVSQVKEIPVGTEVSYGRTFKAAKKMSIATIPLGYADGYPRGMSSVGRVLVAGKPAPIIGRICMDQLMLDVTEIPEAMEGTTVTLFGREHGTFLPVEALASLANTINYEIVCGIGKRVPRVYFSADEENEAYGKKKRYF
jgi:alanine racemase